MRIFSDIVYCFNYIPFFTYTNYQGFKNTSVHAGSFSMFATKDSNFNIKMLVLQQVSNNE